MEQKIIRTYRDTVFRVLFEDPKNALALYNALNGSAYTDASALKITTIKSAVYLSYKNDCSFLYDNYMSLWEHQSTFNPNMPLRGLIYHTQLYVTYIKDTGQNILGSRQVMIPTPQYYVFYNGDATQPERQTLNLSDIFMQPVKQGIYEWTCTMININAGHNQSLMKACKPLADYSKFIKMITDAQKRLEENENAVEQVITYCIKHNILREFLLKERGVVMGWILSEYDAEAVAKINREEAMKEGEKIGRAKGRAETIAQNKLSLVASIQVLLKQQSLPLDDLLAIFHLTREEYDNLVTGLAD